MQQQKSDDESNSTSNVGLPVPGNLSELFDEHDRQQLADFWAFCPTITENELTTMP
jgi:hypothetical protein